MADCQCKSVGSRVGLYIMVLIIMSCVCDTAEKQKKLGQQLDRIELKIGRLNP
jgi:hypothetical protein